MKKLLFILCFLFIYETTSGQLLLPPYHVEPVDTFANYYIAEGNFFYHDSIDYVFIQPTENFKLKKFISIVSSETKRTRKIIKFEKNRIIPKIVINDFDNDSLSELITAVTGNHKLTFYYYNGTDSARTIFSAKIPKEKFNGDYFIVPVQLDEDPAKEIILIISSIMPTSGSFRGMFAIDLEENKLIWKKYFADFVSVALPLQRNDENLIALFTFARGEKLFYANGKFYSKRLPTASDIKIDTTAPDYSCDSVSYLKIYKIENGEEIYRKRLGGKGSWPMLFAKNAENYAAILKFRHISISRTIPDNLIGFNSSDFTLDTLYSFTSYFPGKRRKVSFSSKNIVQINDTAFVVVKNNRLQKIPIKFKGNIKLYNFVKTKIGYLFIATDGINGLFLDENQDVLANTGNLINMYYKENSGDIFYKKNSFNQDFRTTFYRLKALPIYSRLSTQSYLTLIMFLVAIALTFVALWAITLLMSQRKIKRQNVQLEATTSKLIQAEKLSTLGTIAGSIAHQINSPLGAILNASARLKKKGIDDPNLNLITEAGERIKTIVNKFLVTTRSSENEEKGIAFYEVFDDWHTLFSHDFSNQRVKIETDINDGETVLPLTPSELNEIINNLMFNARDSVIKANPAGNRIISVFTQKNGNKFLLKITDNGTGFNKEILKSGIKIFNTTKERGKGTGLGLWIIESILRNVKGEIKIGNHENGAEVTVEIPVMKETEK